MLHYKTYRNANSNEWIVLIHGIGIGSSVWFRQIKEMKKHINILMIDLNGHGKSQDQELIYDTYNPRNVSNDILDILNHEKIHSATFVGLSLGAIVVNAFSTFYPERIDKKILVGGILKLSKLKILFGHFVLHFNKFVTYKTFYTLSSYAMLSGKESKNSRKMFIASVKKMKRQEYTKWFKYCIQHVNKVHKELHYTCPNIYIMGEKDSVLLKPLRHEESGNQHVFLKLIQNAGHVCNIDNYEYFNAVFKECIL